MTSERFYTRDPNLLRRNELYLLILKWGLHRIRDAGHAGDHRHCDVEADHLHNVPSYVGGGDAANHLYYLTKEVPFYISKIDQDGAANVRLLAMYSPLWRELETLVPVQGSPWENDWRALKAGGWNYGKAVIKPT